MRMTSSQLYDKAMEDIAMMEHSLHYFVMKSFHILEPKRSFVDGWHIGAICEHLDACYRGQIRELIINVPPRHMKSIIVSVAFNAWTWTKKPEKRFMTSSYAASLSIRDSVKTRRIIQSDWYQARWGHKFKLTSDQNAKEKFENDHYGYRLATSVGGTGTGEGGDFIIADDPHKVTEAESDPVREGVLAWWDEEMSSRENDPKSGCKIVVMQRVHEKDLAGHIIQQGDAVLLCLPAEYESSRKCVTEIFTDPRKEDGELLWPERFDDKSIATLKRKMGSKTAAGQLQQRPAPAEGNVIKRHWWKFYKERPAEFDKVGISADLTFKDGEKNDYTVFTVWGRVGANKYLLDLVRAHMGINEQLTSFLALISKWQAPDMPGCHVAWIEDAANGAALVALLKKTVPGLIAVPPRGSKVARAEAIAPQAEAGNIWLPDPSIAPWVNDYIEEWAVFPNGEHDDRVDATSLGISKMSEGINSDWTPISLTGTSKWLR